MPSKTFAERILSFVRTADYMPKQVHELACAMGIGEGEHGDFHAACRALWAKTLLRITLPGEPVFMIPPVKVW